MGEKREFVVLLLPSLTCYQKPDGANEKIALKQKQTFYLNLTYEYVQNILIKVICKNNAAFTDTLFFLQFFF